MLHDDSEAPVPRRLETATIPNRDVSKPPEWRARNIGQEFSRE